MLADRKARFHQANASISPIPHIPPNRVNAGTPPTVHHPAQQQTNVRQSPTTDFANTKTPKLLSGRLAYAIELGNVHPPGAKLLQLYLFAFRLRSNRRSPLRVCGGETRLRSRRCLTDPWTEKTPMYDLLSSDRHSHRSCMYESIALLPPARQRPTSARYDSN